MTKLRTNIPVAQLKRSHAYILLIAGTNFFDIAKAYGISPRTLLAWVDHEHCKWDNDPFAGRGPGPDDAYVGEWPSEEQELGQYLTMGLKATDFSDEGLKKRFVEYRKRIGAETRLRSLTPG